MTAGAHLAVLALLIWALRSRMPWSRAGGAVLAVLAGAGLFWTLRTWQQASEVRARLADTDRAPALLFVALSVLLAWWTLRREQVREKPLGLTADLESLFRFLPRPWWPAAGLGLLVLAATFLRAPIGPPPAIGSAAADGATWALQVPWFLAGLGELERHVGTLLAWIVLPVATCCALALTPVLDTGAAETGGPFRGRRDEAPFFLWAWLGLGVMPVAAGVFLPAPWRTRVAPSLAERFWVDLLASPLPDLWVLRELPGIVLLALLFVGLPVGLARWSATRGIFGRHLRRLGRTRYALLTTLLTLFVLVPFGLAARVLGLGPWLVLPGGWWL